jgi:two-component system, chemotaxis family, response regulator Rcp1
MTGQPTYRILLIEDNRADAELLKIAVSECKEVKAVVDVLADSTRLTHYLHGQGEFEGVHVPDMIILDYHHPVNGGVALAQLAGSPDLIHIPVLVLTGSDDPKVIDEAYSRHANCVLRKPCDLDSMIELVCDIERFWFKKAVLPVRRQPSAPNSAVV